MPQDLDKIIQIKKAAEADLLQRPGVTGVDVGYKYVGGQKTDEIVIRVHVAEKKDVSSDEKIPDSVHGVKTDVLENRFVPASDTDSHDPILGGISIGPFRLLDGGSVYGTLGAIVIDQNSQARMLLSNYHVLCVNEGWKDQISHWKNIVQPEMQPNFFKPREIAKIEKGILNKEMDAAVARLQNVDYVCEIQDIGPITGTADPLIDMAVRKRGRTTGLTYGTITGLEWKGPLDYGHGVGKQTLEDQILIYRDEKRSARFGDEGDSGSVVVNENGQVIGLLIATSETTGVATPIKVVLDGLNVRMALEGIGGYDLSDSADRAFAFDYQGTGRLDDLVLYRPGKGLIWILKKASAELFLPVYKQRDAGGIGGYDLSDSADQAFAFDYTGIGKLDHLVLYRPGKGAINILKNDREGNFSTVYKGSGIGGYDLSDSADRAFAFDYGSTGALNYLVFYRPGKGAIYILTKDGVGNYYPIYKRDSGSGGIGGYDLSDSADRAFAFDYEGTGHLDDLVLYRPGKGIFWILKRNITKDGTVTFERVYPKKGEPNAGVGGFDLASGADRVLAFDYEGTGHLDDLVLYRPGEGAIFILQRNGTEKDGITPKFKAVYQQPQRGKGIGGFDLTSDADRVFAFDYEGTGHLNDLVLYRPGEGAIFILQRNGTEKDGITPKFKAVYQATK